MAGATYLARSEYVVTPPIAQEVVSQVYFVLENTNPTKAVHLRRVWWDLPVFLLPNSSATPSALTNYGLGRIEARRASAVSGGMLLTAASFDGNNALPSQVTVRVRPTDVTLGDLLGQGGEQATTPGTPNLTNTGLQLASFATGRALPMARMFNWRAAGPSQPWRLQAGEGLAITQSVSAIPRTTLAEIVLREVATGETYSYVTDLFNPLLLDRPTLVIFNGAGSGVAIDVVSVNACSPFGITTNSSQDDHSQGVGLSYVSQRRWPAGESVLISSYDSANPAVPEGVSIRRLPNGAEMHDRLMTGILTNLRATVTNIQSQINGHLRTTANYRIVPGTMLNWPVFRSGRFGLKGRAGVPVFGGAGNGIVLQPGDSMVTFHGFAMNFNQYTSFTNYDVCFEFTLHDIPGNGTDTSIRPKPAFKPGAVI